jgi:phosphate transport system substrate-binding protein
MQAAVKIATGFALLLFLGCSNGGTGSGQRVTEDAKAAKASNPLAVKQEPTDSSTVRRLNGGGSSFVYPLMTKWVRIYKEARGVEVDYASTGSGNGIQQMTVHNLDFGCSDAPMNEQQLQKAAKEGGNVLHIPLVMGGVVPAYNLPEIDKPLRFTGEILAGIFLGEIKKWNDPKLRAVNDGVNLPDRDIAVVHRSDGSGTTYIWTDYLSKVSPAWKEKMGVNTIIKWPSGQIAQKGTEGVAGQVMRSPGAIGYVEVIFALQSKIQYGSVQNAAGEFITPTLESVTAAARASIAEIPDDLRYSLTNAPGKDAYPISGTTWALVYERQKAAKAEVLVNFLRWVTHEGQAYAKDLKYARIPEELIGRIDEKLQRIKPAE